MLGARGLLSSRTHVNERLTSFMPLAPLISCPWLPRVGPRRAQLEYCSNEYSNDIAVANWQRVVNVLLMVCG